MGDFALNGLLGTYPLFLLSTSQWRTLLDDAGAGRLLDIGAACGDVTDRLAPLFDEVTVTEVNRPMVKALRRKGYDAHQIDVTIADIPGSPFDVVAALNVLDRCSHPRTLLRRLAELTAPGGHLVVSIPLPYRPCWYDGPRLAEPVERLPLSATDFDTAARALAAVLEIHGTQVTAIARAPYLSGGDLDAASYELEAAIVVARKT